MFIIIFYYKDKISYIRLFQTLVVAISWLWDTLASLSLLPHLPSSAHHFRTFCSFYLIQRKLWVYLLVGIQCTWNVLNRWSSIIGKRSTLLGLNFLLAVYMGFLVIICEQFIGRMMIVVIRKVNKKGYQPSHQRPETSYRISFWILCSRNYRLHFETLFPNSRLMF